MKFFKDMLTESDNQTWCMFRVGCGLAVTASLLGAFYACVHYGFASGAAFDPSKIGALMSDMGHDVLELLGATSAAVAAKKVSGADASQP